MPRKTRLRAASPVSVNSPPPAPSKQHEDDEGVEDTTLDEPPAEIDPYEVLSLSKDATADQIKTAYRKAALKHHPDKASTDGKYAANKKFQEIAFAYAILSDEKRRKRYDTTGNTAETLEGDEDFDWVDFFRSQTEAIVSGEMIEKIKREYQGSDEERADVLRIYEECEGDMDGIFEGVMCSEVLVDEERFRKLIDEAIQKGEVENYEKYAKDGENQRKARRKRAKVEEAEAMELAEELGVRDKLFGNGSAKEKGGKKGKGKKDASGGEDALKALIQQRQKGRAENFLDNLEAKYAGKTKGKRGAPDEPPEEAFQKNAKKPKTKAR